VYFLRSGTRQGCPLKPLLFNIVVEALTRAIRKEKNKLHPNRKRESDIVTGFDYMILYIKNSEDSTENY
jgi:hypothetical protein